MQLLNLGLTEINLMLIFMLGALSLNFLTGCAGLISIGHAAFYATDAMTGAQLEAPFPVVFVAAALYAYYLTSAKSESFTLMFAIQFIAMIIIGGPGSLGGSLLGAAVWLLLRTILTGFAAEAMDATGIVRLLLVEHRAQFVQAIFGGLVIVLLIFAPGGVADLTRRLGRLLKPGGGS